MKKLALLLVILSSIVFTGCKDGWGVTQAQNTLRLPKELPSQYTSPRGAKVFSDTVPSQEVLNLIDVGIQNQLTMSIAFRNRLQNEDGTPYTKQWNRFTKHSDYSVLLLEPTAYSIHPTYTGCPLLKMFSNMTVAGAFVGVRRVNGKPREDYPMIVVPKPITNRQECQDVFVGGVQNESEHNRLLNDGRLFYFYTGLNDQHPIFQ